MKYAPYFFRLATVAAVHRKTSGKHAAQLAAVLLLTLGCLAQQPAATPNPDAQPAKRADDGKTTAALPAGTRISLQVMHPIATRVAHPGDSIDLQVTTPV